MAYIGLIINIFGIFATSFVLYNESDWYVGYFYLILFIIGFIYCIDDIKETY